jgi:hypothetical protein
MTDFATTADLAARLGITLTGPETTRATTLISQGTDLVRSHAKQTISKVTGDVLVTRGIWGNRLLLPERPVIQVTQVQAQFMQQGTIYTIDPLSYFVDRDELVRFDWPLSFTAGNGWFGPGWQLSITYDHGFDQAANPVPYKLGVCKAICLDAVIRAWVNPSNLAQSSIGGILESYPPGSGMLLTPEEKYNLDDLFRREHGTISLR